MPESGPIPHLVGKALGTAACPGRAAWSGDPMSSCVPWKGVGVLVSEGQGATLGHAGNYR